MLAIDIETYSDIDLRKAGLYKYAASPAFGILLIAYAIDDEPVKIIDLMNNEDTTEFEKLLLDPTMLKSAYNAQFEITCLSSWLGAQLDPAQWRCTMVQAATLGLPRSLEDVANTLGLTERKMSEGKALIKYFCQPCNPTAVNGGRTRNYPFHAEDRWNTFKTYCGQDVEVERAVRGAMANYPVIDGEQHAWELDQRINCRGVQADLDLVNAAIDLSTKHSDALRQESQSLSGLDNPNSVAQLKDYLGVDSLTKKDVKAMVEDADGAHRQILENRLELGKTSVSKYIAIQNCILPDSRVRGLFQFYGASRTGRWAGRLVQLQNLPQNHLPDLDMARELVLARDLNGIKTKVSPSINQVLSELVRTAFTAKPGHIFAVADFSAIEARVLAWLADEKWRLDVFATHGKIYEASAEKMFNLPAGSIQKGDPMRQKGKVAELALGYGGSVGALTAMGAVDMGLESDELPGLVTAWRHANPSIVRLWYKVNDAAMAAVKREGYVDLPKGLKATRTGSLLHIALPSGRALRYFRPNLGVNRFGGDAICYQSYDAGLWGRVDTYGAKLVENIVQAIARDCLRDAMMEVEKFWPEIVMHIHDEMVVEVPEEYADIALKQITDIMAKPLPWAPGLQLCGDGYLTKYYKKD